MTPEQFIQETAKEAGKITLSFFDKAEVQYSKAHSLDVVTQADLASNKYITEQIKKHFPDDGIISEETGESNTDAKYIWIIDPLDGTLNFSKGIPIFGVFIARAKAGVVELGTIVIPIHNELYFAKKGKGAFLNGKKIHCSKVVTLDDSVGSAGSGLRGDRLPLWKNLIKASKKNKIIFSSFFCMAASGACIASGKTDWYMMFGGGMWDHAANSLILKEAGCTVTNVKGEPWTLKDSTMFAANPKLHKLMMKIMWK